MQWRPCLQYPGVTRVQLLQSIVFNFGELSIFCLFRWFALPAFIGVAAFSAESFTKDFKRQMSVMPSSLKRRCWLLLFILFLLVRNQNNKLVVALEMILSSDNHFLQMRCKNFECKNRVYLASVAVEILKTKKEKLRTKNYMCSSTAQELAKYNFHDDGCSAWAVLRT